MKTIISQDLIRLAASMLDVSEEQDSETSYTFDSEFEHIIKARHKEGGNKIAGIVEY